MITDQRSRHRALALLLTGLVLAGSWWPVGGRVEQWGYSLAAGLLPPGRATPPVTVIALDDSICRQWPNCRAELAAALRRLHRNGARVIGLMPVLDRPSPALPLTALRAIGTGLDHEARARLATLWTHLDPDAQLADALARADRVVLAAPATPTGSALPPQLLAVSTAAHWYDGALRWVLAPPARRYRVQQPLPRFKTANVAVAALPIRHGGDWISGVPRQLVTAQSALPGFAWRLAHAASPTLPATGADGLFHPYPYAGQSVHVYTLTALLKGAVPAPAIRNRVVLIGPTVGVAALRGPAGGTWTPVTWTANAVSHLLGGDGVRMPAWFFGAQRGALLLLGLYLLWLPQRLRGRTGLLISAVIILALLNGGLVALLTRDLWLPVVAPALFLLAAQSLLYLNHRGESAFALLRADAAEARRLLGLNLQNQGQPDGAFEQFRHCGRNPALYQPLYELGLEYERRRQFAKALTTYDYLAGMAPAYKDVGERRAHLRTVAAHTPGIAAPGAARSSTVVLDNPAVEKPTLGRYRLERELGRGAMGTVYLGEDPKIGRRVAIKTLELGQEFEGRALEEARSRFLREASAVGRLDHPNIVSVHDVGEEHDLAYIAMDYVEGRSLDAWTEADQLLPAKEVLELCAQVAEALDYAHRQKVVHRDIKPGNLLYDRDAKAVKVSDFGVASLLDESKTRTGTVLGSPSYMSPEQVTGKKVNGRSDLYSLGVTLYQLLTGQLPFVGDSLANLTYRITNTRQVSVNKLRRGLPACAARVVNKALQKDAAKRYADGAEMAEALRRCARR